MGEFATLPGCEEDSSLPGFKNPGEGAGYRRRTVNIFFFKSFQLPRVS